MNRSRAYRTAIAGTAAALFAGAALAGASTAAASASHQAAAPRTRDVCGTATRLHAQCAAQIRLDIPAQTKADAAALTISHATTSIARAHSVATAAASLPAGYGPIQLDSAYHLPVARGAKQTVALIDGFDDPNAEADLAVYRATYGLPACSEATKCFTKINQLGETGPYPAEDDGWASETSLDLDMVSASCPKCHIMLVEANTSALSDLAASVDTAVKAGAHIISNSYTVPEYLLPFDDMTPYYQPYEHAGTTILAASGDDGFQAANYPAITPGVIAVGGTSLSTSSTPRGWQETAWVGSGSGCSAYVAKPSYQKDTHCGMRTISDISAVADPDATGLAVYDTTPNDFGLTPGWLVLGGTSASTPLIAGMVALAGNATTLTTASLYHHPAAINDVVGGSNGACGRDYLCTAKKGYDGPTGVGTPDGTGAL